MYLWINLLYLMCIECSLKLGHYTFKLHEKSGFGGKLIFNLFWSFINLWTSNVRYRPPYFVFPVCLTCEFPCSIDYLSIQSISKYKVSNKIPTIPGNHKIYLYNSIEFWCFNHLNSLYDTSICMVPRSQTPADTHSILFIYCIK